MMRRRMTETLFIGMMTIGMTLSGCASAGTTEAPETSVETETVVETSQNTEAVTAESTEAAALEPAAISEQLLVDQEGFRIVANEYISPQTSKWGSLFKDSYVLKLTNNTGHKIRLSVKEYRINGIRFYADSLYITTLDPGFDQNYMVDLPVEELLANGVTRVESIEMKWVILDADTNNQLFESELCRILVDPYHESAGFDPNDYPVIQMEDEIMIEESHIRPDNYSIDEQVLVEQDGIRITILSNTYPAVNGEYEYGEAPWICYENNTENTVTIDTIAATVNGMSIQNWCNKEKLSAGEKSTCRYGNNEAEYFLKNGITQIGTLGFQFTVTNTAEHEDIFDTEMIYIETSRKDQVSDKVLPERYLVYDSRDAAGIQIYATYRIDEESGDLVITGVLKNDTEKNLNLQMNGYDKTVGKYFSCDYDIIIVPQGAYASTEFRFPASSFSEKEPESFLYDFTVFDHDTWDEVVGWKSALSAN